MEGLISKGTYIRGLSLMAHKMSRSPYLPVKIFTIYIEALTGFSHIFNPNGLNNLPSSLKVAYFKQLLRHRNFWQDVHSKDRGAGEEPLITQSTSGHIVSIISSKKNRHKHTKQFFSVLCFYVSSIH